MLRQWLKGRRRDRGSNFIDGWRDDRASPWDAPDQFEEIEVMAERLGLMGSASTAS